MSQIFPYVLQLFVKSFQQVWPIKDCRRIYPENECAKEPLPNGVLIEPALAPLIEKPG